MLRGYLNPHNGGFSVLDYCFRRGGRFGKKLVDPFNAGAGIGFSARDPTLWTALRRLLFPVFVLRF
jgi:hypothetical protein